MKDINQRIANLSPAKRALLEQQLQKKGNTLEFLSQLRNLGIHISTDGEKLRCNAPKDALTPSLRAELAERKAEIIALLQNNNVNGNSTQSTIQRIPQNQHQDLPLSFAQQRLWFLDQLEPNSPFYNMSRAVRLNGDLKIPVLQQALDAIVVHHEILLTNYTSNSGNPIQVIAAPQSVKLQFIDLQQHEEAERETQVKTILQQESQRPFNLASDMMLRGCLLQLAQKEYVLLLVVHHIASDGWSTGILWEQLAQLYKTFLEGKPNPLTKLPIQYADYAVWQREWLTGEVLEKQLNYWKRQLAGANTVLELPTDNPRPPVQTYKGASQLLTLPRSLNDKLQQLCRQEGVTLYMTLLAAFGTLLYRYTGQEDILIGSPVAGRNRAEIEPLIGFFVNTVVLRTSFSQQDSFRSLLAKVREATLGAYDRQAMPFEKLVEEFQLERDTSRNPLFQVWFNMLNLKDIELKLPGLDVESISTGEAASKFDLTLYLAEQEDGLKLKLVYNADLFATERMVEMLNQYHYLLNQIVENPEVNINDLSIVTQSAKSFLPNPEQQLPGKWEGIIYDKFSQQVQRVPQHLALVDAQVTWTYDELEKRANQLANYLLESNIQQQDIVAIYAQRSASLVWAILGVLKAGAAFVILDPAYPASRLIDCLQLVKPCGWLQIVSEQLPTDLKEYVDSLSCDCQLNIPDSTLVISDLLQDYSTDTPEVTIEPDNLAYIAFTSASTGKPKGIKGTHRPISHFIQWHCQTFELKQSDRFSMLCGLSHDPLLRDIFTPLSLGATLYIPKQEDIYSPPKLTGWILEQQITIAHLTPAMGQMLSSDTTITTKYLRYLFFGGDVLTKQNVERITKFAPNAKSVNFYGSTETPQAMGYFIIPHNYVLSKDTVPLGQGIDDVQLLLINSKQQLAGIGELAEIYVRTPYLTKGYINSTMTEERFIINPFAKNPEDKLYKTGDLGRYLSDGNIEFCGRIDNQVKIRGFRIELGEIESVLNTHPQIQQAVVIVREDIPDNKRLVTYLTKDKSLTTKEVREFIKQKLPEYMVPNTFIILENLPLTPNGKVDKKALPAPDLSSIKLENNFVPPSNTTEETLANIWADILGVEQIGIHDNFFELGGHSLLAMRLVAKIEQVTEKKLPLAALFKFTTISELANLINKEKEVVDINQNSSTDLASIDTDNLRGLLTIMAGREGTRPRPDSLMVAFRETGEKPPLFFCANATWEIRPLTKYLGEEQPIYLLESGYAVFDQKGQLNKAPGDDIKAIATRHVRDILLVQPEGAYYLVGYSFGKLVAYEVAKQLQKSGKEIAFLAILDTPGSGKIYQYTKKILIGIAEISEDLFSGSLVGFTKRIGSSTWKLKEDFIETFRTINQKVFSSKSTINKSELECNPILKQQQNNSEIKQSTSYLEQNKEKYIMEGYQGKITLFVTSLTRRNHNKILRRLFPSMGWNKHLIEKIKVPGDHNSMVREPDVKALAEKLTDILANLK